MNYKIAFVLTNLILFFSCLNQAQDKSCIETNARIGNLQVSTVFISQSNTCWVSVHDLTAYKTLVYRDFMFGNDGLFMVFNSYGEGPPSQKTGAREYYTFPRQGSPSFELDHQNQLLRIQLTTHEIITMNAHSMKVVSMSDSQFLEDAEIHPKNKGGFEILSHSKILLDCGFRMGGSPSTNPKNKCTFSDATGSRCLVVPQDIFEYSSSGDSDLKFKTDHELAQFLSVRCPQLDHSALRQVL